MRVPEWRPALTAAHDAALEWLEHLAERPVRPEVDYEAMYAVLHEPLPDEGLPAERVIAELDAAVRPGLMAMNHGRFFGWVIGGSTPAGVAADWLVARSHREICYNLAKFGVWQRQLFGPRHGPTIHIRVRRVS